MRRLARARTLVVLDVLGSARQNRVLRFLEETELIQARPPDRPSIISLKYASLRDFKLIGKQLLRSTDLTQAGLTQAELSAAHLQGTNLSLAHLGEADLPQESHFEATRFTASTRTSGFSKNITWPASTLRTPLCGHCWATSRSIST